MNDEETRVFSVPKPGRYGRSVMMPPMFPVNEAPDERDLPLIDISGPVPVLVSPGRDRTPKPQGEAERAA
jgi:hypothetical protein